jgi:glycosyltransferase involved in cell wall biosynthesis
MGDVTVSVVIPALNEADNLRLVLPLVPDWVHEVILVDGRSTDGTAHVAREVRPDIRFVQQQGRGKGAALRTGFAAARGDIVVTLDADGSTDPREIPAFVRALTDGADFAKGSRFLRGGGTTDMTWYRQLGNLGFVLMVRLLFGGRYTDLCYGYNAFWRRIVPQLGLDCDGFEIETMMNIRALKVGLRVVEVASFEHERIHGVSRLRTFPDGMRVLRTIIGELFRPLPEPRIAGLHSESEPSPGTSRAASDAAPAMVAIPVVTDRPRAAIPVRAYEELAPAVVAEAE